MKTATREQILNLMDLSPHEVLVDEILDIAIKSPEASAYWLNKVLDAVINDMLEYQGRDSKMVYLQIVNKRRGD